MDDTAIKKKRGRPRKIVEIPRPKIILPLVEPEYSGLKYKKIILNDPQFMFIYSSEMKNIENILAEFQNSINQILKGIDKSANISIYLEVK